MDLKNNKKPNDDLEYIVMPKLGRSSPMPPPPPSPIKPAKEMPKHIPVPKPPSGGKKTAAIVGGIITALVLAAAGYYAYQQMKDKSVSIQPQLDFDNLQNSKSDDDTDGLDNEREAAVATDPKKADSDGDGLADGDEVNIYGSDPLLFDTDSDSFDDGQEVVRGYSPVINTADRASDAERQKWLQKSVEFGLHEPTNTTLRTKASGDGAVTDSKTVYVNSAYNYSVEYTNSMLALCEEDNGQKVGIYIAGSMPEENIQNDPFTIFLLGQMEAQQDLKQWLELRLELFESQQELVINGLPVIRRSGLDLGEGCKSDMTFFTKNNSIMVVKWYCSEVTALEPFYATLINSFKFR